MPAKRRSSKAATPEGQPSFEQAVDQLEGIIDRIESGEVGLEQSLEQYEQGMKLVARCRTILDRAQQRFAELTVDQAGNLVVEGDSDQEQ